MKRRWIFSLLTASLVAGMVGTSYAEVKVSGGELRVRGVMVDNGEANMDGGFWEQRTRVNAEASVDDKAKVFVQIQDSRKWGEKKGVVGDQTLSTGQDVEGLDLSQGYVELSKLFGSPVSLKIGRQAMAYGEHRLIGSLEWSNNARRFDAIKGTVQIGDAADIDFWTAKIRENELTATGLGGADWGNDVNLNGIYGMLKMVRNHAIDVYLLQKIDGTETVEANFYTLGARIKGDINTIGLDYAAEIASQFGKAKEVANKDIDKAALAYAVRIGYTIPKALQLRFGAEIAGASGDDDTTDDKDNDFDNLYPTNHYLYGFTDDVNWSNMGAFGLFVGLSPIANLKLAAEYWSYAFNKKDSTAGNLDITDNGSEINGKVNYAMSKNINLEAAYVIRDASEVATTSYGGYGAIPADESATFGYLMLNVKFM